MIATTMRRFALFAVFVGCGGTPTTNGLGPTASLSAQTIDFGAGECGGAASDSRTLTIRNDAPAGSESLSYSVTLTDALAFSITSATTSGSLLPGESADIVIAPAQIPSSASAGQTLSSSIVVQTNDTLHAVEIVPLKITARGATFTVSPTGLDFGQIPVDYWGAVLPVTVKNVGNEAAQVSFVQPSDTTMTMDWKGAPAPMTVAPLDTVTGLVATFLPVQPGKVLTTATLKVDGAMCGVPSPPIQLRGEGMNGVVGISPGTVDFGLVSCGTTAVAKPLVLFNTGNAPFDFGADLKLAQYSAFTVFPQSGSVPPNGAVTLVITPRPMPQSSPVTPNFYGDTLTISTTAIGDSLHEIPVLETASGAIITASPYPIAFGHQVVGATASVQLTFTNSGNAPASIQASTSWPFSVSSPVYVPANGTSSANVGYWPDKSRLGINAVDSVTLSTNSVLCGPLPFSIPTSGTPIDVATSVSVGDHHACALGSSSNVYCWGFNSLGQIGDWTTTPRYTPTCLSWSGATGLAVAGSSSCAIFGNYAATCWGDNYYGQLGNGNTYNTSGPTNYVYNLTNPVKLSGSGFSFCALRGGGDVACWGSDYAGNFGAGDNTTTVTSAMTAFGGINDVVDLASAGWVTCVARQGGAVECAGRNSMGQLGDGTTTDSNVPVTVANVSNASAVATTGSTSCAMLSTGAVSCWGAGGAGTLGNGSNANSLTPVTVSGLNDATSIAASTAVCATRSGGSVVCWGDNTWGQLGNGGYSNSNVPVTVSNLANATNVSVGGMSTCAVHDNGKVSCWGHTPFANALTPISIDGFN